MGLTNRELLKKLGADREILKFSKKLEKKQMELNQSFSKFTEEFARVKSIFEKDIELIENSLKILNPVVKGGTSHE